jgi:hypothetical protein
MTSNSEPIRQDEPGPNAHQEADRQTHAPDEQILSTTAKPEIPPTKCQCCGPHKENKHWIDYATVVLEIVGLIVLCIYAGYTIKIYCANREAADAAKSAADTAARQLELTERPWVFIKDARVVSPLRFDADRAQVYFEMVLRNSGPSPAVDVFLYPQLYLLHGEEPAAPLVERLCTNKIPKGESRPGLTVFPETDSPPQRITVQVTRQELANASKHPPGVPAIAGITPVICVWYRPTFNPEARYYSGIQYLLWPTIFPDRMQPGSNVPINNLPLNRNEFFGEVAH